jgi:hypothetical protein
VTQNAKVGGLHLVGWRGRGACCTPKGVLGLGFTCGPPGRGRAPRRPLFTSMLPHRQHWAPGRDVCVLCSIQECVRTRSLASARGFWSTAQRSESRGTPQHRQSSDPGHRVWRARPGLTQRSTPAASSARPAQMQRTRPSCRCNTPAWATTTLQPGPSSTAGGAPIRPGLICLACRAAHCMGVDPSVASPQVRPPRAHGAERWWPAAPSRLRCAAAKRGASEPLLAGSQ